FAQRRGCLRDPLLAVPESREVRDHTLGEYIDVLVHEGESELRCVDGSDDGVDRGHTRSSNSNRERTIVSRSHGIALRAWSVSRVRAETDIVAAGGHMTKIKVKAPVVELDGDELTRV